jgi:ABC-type antimicrobial peptide transport system permease subunit
VFNFVVLGLSFLVAVGMASWAGVSDHRWKRYVLVEDLGVSGSSYFGFFWLARVMLSGLIQVLSV